MDQETFFQILKVDKLQKKKQEFAKQKNRYPTEFNSFKYLKKFLKIKFIFYHLKTLNSTKINNEFDANFNGI